MKAIPDRWVVVNIVIQGKLTQRVFAGWYGGYLGNNSWQLNSGIASAAEFPDRWEFTGISNSLYVCHKSAYGMSTEMSRQYNLWTSKLQSGDALSVADEYQPSSEPIQIS